MRSSDNGATWSTLPRPGRTAKERRSLRVVQAAFSSAKVGLLCDTNGRVWRTTNAGRAWTLLTAVGTQEVTGLAVDSSRTATLVVGRFANVAGGYLLRSNDSGATWQPQFVVNEAIGARGLAAGDGVDYLLAGDAGLLFSTTGGVAGDPSDLTLATKRHRLTRAGRITVTGRLQPAGGSAQVTVSELVPGTGGWSHQTVSVASNGTFATAWSVPRGTTTFVAQWTGDFKSARRRLAADDGDGRAREKRAPPAPLKPRRDGREHAARAHDAPAPPSFVSPSDRLGLRDRPRAVQPRLGRHEDRALAGRVGLLAVLRRCPCPAPPRARSRAAA